MDLLVGVEGADKDFEYVEGWLGDPFETCHIAIVPR
jgi:hypothetical protein